MIVFALIKDCAKSYFVKVYALIMLANSSNEWHTSQR